MPKSATVALLKPFVRSQAAHYLDRANVTSIGIGRKKTKGKSTGQLAVVFTVGKKVAPEGLAAAGLEALPKTVTVAGVVVPTDVQERVFARHERGDGAPEAVARKRRLDPIVPGVSIAHERVSAGTVGAVVYDAESGAPYVLSNWHVLHGAAGAIGDAIAQPGPHDDNRVAQNLCGHLVRSHLGVAGDCAIAAIEGRRLAAEIAGLGVAVEKIAEAQLDDEVIKSGRTTGVTRGRVTRVHVTSRIDYGAAGAQDIGGFEIEPDPRHPARGGEISMGGDSGAVWLKVVRNRPTSTMLGLHFAGEVGAAPEHALACNASAVFEKLGILPRPPGGVQRVRTGGVGFATDFLGQTVALPEPDTRAVAQDLVTVGAGPVIDYTHFSLAMSRHRRFARWVAWNIDGSSIKRITRDGIRFKKDPRVPADGQVGDELYAGNPLDRGHIARRQDLLWGPVAEAERANVDSFYFTNITPQHEAFNQSGANGLWGELENAIFADVDVERLRVSVIGGPFLGERDPEYRGVQLPREFYKILYWQERGDAALRAKGYVLTQRDLLRGLEALELPEYAVYEVPIGEIGRRTGLRLPGSDQPSPQRAGRRRAQAEAEAQPRIRRIGSVREILP
jgi:endonuclease G